MKCPACMSKVTGPLDATGLSFPAALGAIMASHAHLTPQPDPNATTWAGVSRGLGRNDMPDALWQAFWDERLDADELRKGIAQAWVMAEWPEHSIGTENWLEMWDEAIDLGTEYLHDNEVRSRDDLPDQVRLYRAAQPKYSYGMAWTDDKDQAIWFRDRLAGLGGSGPAMKLYWVDAVTRDVLARFEGRNESEWVLDPGGIEPEIVKG